MSASRTRPGNANRGWNDPPMFNYGASQDGSSPPKRALNKRVAFPVSGSNNGSPIPGHAVLNPSQGPPILNPVLSPDIQGPPLIPSHPPVPISLRDMPLGNQAAPKSAIQLLPPTADISTPQIVPILVPILVPSSPPKTDDQVPETVKLTEERLEELMNRLCFNDDTQLLQENCENFGNVFDKYRNILTLKVCDEIQKKLEIFEERWKKGSLGDIVKVRITQLSTALVNGDTDQANHLHLALMVDHITEVNQWMMGVKRLLQQQQLANKGKEIIAENRLEPEPEMCKQNSSEGYDLTVVSKEADDLVENETEVTSSDSNVQSREVTVNEDDARDVAVNDDDSRDVAVNNDDSRNVAVNDDDSRDVAVNDNDSRDVAVNDNDSRDVAVNEDDSRDVAWNEDDSRDVAVNDNDSRDVAVNGNDSRDVAVNGNDSRDVAVNDDDSRDVAVNDDDSRDVAFNEDDSREGTGRALCDEIECGESEANNNTVCS